MMVLDLKSILVAIDHVCILPTSPVLIDILDGLFLFSILPRIDFLTLQDKLVCLDVEVISLFLCELLPSVCILELAINPIYGRYWTAPRGVDVG